MDKYRKKMIKYNAEGIIYESEQYHYFNHHNTFICDESLGWRPRVDMFEVKNYLNIIVDMPYIDPDTVEILIEKDCIMIKGVRDQIGCDRKRHYHKMEIDFGPFERRINLPVSIDISTIKRNYRRGFYIISAKISTIYEDGVK
ncbi:MAG: Hsp20/alpha crystallin family protein [Candidatus Delongbacteria bacterium]